MSESDKPSGPQSPSPADATPTEARFVMDYSKEPAGIFVNVINVAEANGMFVLLFAEALPMPDRMFNDESGTPVVPMNIAASLRVQTLQMGGMIEAMISNWNRMRDRLPPAARERLLSFEVRKPKPAGGA